MSESTSASLAASLAAPFAILRNAVRATVTDILTANLSKDRWTAVYGFHGLVVGRRLVKRLGIIGFFALDEDDTFRFEVLPVDSAPLSSPEEDIRRDFVRLHKRGYVERGHEYAPSPVYPDLCAFCARDVLDHARERKRMIYEQALGTLDLRISFVEGSADVERVFASKRLLTPEERLRIEAE